MTVDPAQAQARLFEALSRCFLGLAGQGPLLLCLDDLHWADAATLGWLAALPRWLDGSRICLLASCRPAEADVLADVKRAFARPGRLAEIELARLSAGDVAVLLYLGSVIALVFGSRWPVLHRAAADPARRLASPRAWIPSSSA